MKSLQSPRTKMAIALLAALLSASPAVADAGPPDSTCRALLDLTGPPLDPATGLPADDAGDVAFVADLRVGPRSVAESARGMVVRHGADTYALELVRHQRSDTGPAGTSTHRTWNRLLAMRLPDGPTGVWLDGEPEPSFPEAGSRHPYEQHTIYSVAALVGPYLSLEQSSHGYTGGAHGYTHDTFLTLRAPSGERVALDLGPEAMAAMVAAVREQSELRRRERGDDEDLVPPQDLSEAGLSFAGGGLQLSSVLFCCTWAENHNTLRVDAPLPGVPPPLRPHLALSAAPGDSGQLLFEAPDGCGAVGLASGHEGLAVRRGRAGALATVRLPGFRPERILGVYWIPARDPFRISLLPPAPD